MLDIALTFGSFKDGCRHVLHSTCDICSMARNLLKQTLLPDEVSIGNIHAMDAAPLPCTLPAVQICSSALAS